MSTEAPSFQGPEDPPEVNPYNEDGEIWDELIPAPSAPTDNDRGEVEDDS